MRTVIKISWLYKLLEFSDKYAILSDNELTVVLIIRIVLRGEFLDKCEAIFFY